MSRTVVFWIVGALLFGALLGYLGHRAHLGRLSPPMILVLRITLGIVFILLGIVGSLLPVLQGWMFFLLAFLVLFPNSPWAVKALDKVEPKMPRMVARLRKFGIGCHRDDDTMQAR